MPPSLGEKWLSLIRAYGPVAENDAQQAELLRTVTQHLGVPKLSFEHPAKQFLIECFSLKNGAFKNVVLTGTAGEGKTSLCFELVQHLTGEPPRGKSGVEDIVVDTEAGARHVKLIYDVTAWRTKTNGHLSPDDVDLLERMAESAFGESDKFFVLAVNDGQMHELFRALPDSISPILTRLRDSLIGMHARGERDAGSRLHMINLSWIPSERIMELCLEAVLERPEWKCIAAEKHLPVFSESSSIVRNYRTLSSPEVRDKLLTLARIADVTGSHLPTRGVLCLISNALLGHPEAKDRVLRPGNEANTISIRRPELAALHRTFFGENLTRANRRKRDVYRFLSMLHIGEETTNELDDLLVFGSRDRELERDYSEVVKPDPFKQQNPQFEPLLRKYIKGDIVEEDEVLGFLDEVASERRRIFLRASSEQMEKYSLWRTTVFHFAREYLDELRKPLENGRAPNRAQVRRVAAGLNRTWTGMLLESQHQVYLATGLDLTTSAVSDLFLAQLDLDSEPAGLEVVKKDRDCIPFVLLRMGTNQFEFRLTLTRFEFLCRVAEGAMPSSFSKESCADFMALKQRALRDLKVKGSRRALQLIDVQTTGNVQLHPIHLPE